MRPTYACYSFLDVEFRLVQHYIVIMTLIMNDRQLALDSLDFLYRRVKRKNSQKLAKAVYLRYFCDMKYREIAEELNISTERARQLSRKGLWEINKYINRKYKGYMI